ncbi:hypothetical protein N665_0475s0053 [Sinapis alba]|nr:hypothetical protein N665_0475s0053 [Sinapis alba]
MIEVYEMNSTTMKFRITDQATRNRVFRRGMWNLAGIPVVMTQWKPFVEEEKTEESIPLWVHLRNIPLNMFSWKGLSFVTSSVGVPVRLHPDTAQCKDLEVAKVFVNVDLTKELPKSMNFSFQGKDTLVDFTYSRLPAKCSSCGRWGHLSLACLKKPSPTEQAQVQSLVTTPVVEAKATAEVGEITDIAGEEEWSTPTKVGKSPERKAELDLGHVSILSKSPFAVLALEEKEGEMVGQHETVYQNEEEKYSPAIVEQEDVQGLENISATPIVSLPTTIAQGRDKGIVPRQTLPRLSKDNHRIIPNPTAQKTAAQKTTDPGFNKSKKQSVVRKWIQKNAMKFGCIIETRVKEGRMQHIVSSAFPHWSAISNYEHHRLGKLWVVWNQEVRITPCFKSSQMITVSVLMGGMEEEFLCSFVYASNVPEERRELWNDLKDHQDSTMFKDKPWIVVGDFNEILELEDHVGHNIPTVSMGMREFQEVIRHNRFMDMKAHGPKLTWSNKRKDELIQRKLDRTLINDVWITKFPQTYCVFEAGGCSDHLRCRIQLTAESLKPKRPFKFTNVITESPDFLPLVEKYWEGTTPLFSSTSALHRLSKKLKELKPSLRELSRKQVGDITKKTKAAYDTLCSCQLNAMTNPSPLMLDEETRAYERWVSLSSIEEKVLSQRAKGRAAKNSIREIQKEDGTIVDTQEDIKNEAVD